MVSWSGARLFTSMTFTHKSHAANLHNEDPQTATTTITHGQQQAGSGVIVHVHPTTHTQEVSQDAVLPTVKTLHQIPSVAHAANDGQASYNVQT